MQNKPHNKVNYELNRKEIRTKTPLLHQRGELTGEKRNA
jgi:hypothetical protein